MDFLLNPNVAYLFLLGGFLLGMLALATPGTGLFEVGAVFCLLIAGYAVYNLSFNGWALFLLAVSVIPFVYATQKPRREAFLALAIGLLVVGSMFMFPSEDAWFAVNPLVALFSSGLVAGFLWIAARKTMEAATALPKHDLSGLVGQIGEARTGIHEEGSVYVGGELWSAKSVDPIPAFSPVKVVARDGFVIVVEKAD